MSWLKDLLGIGKEGVKLSDKQKLRIFKFLQDNHAVNIIKFKNSKEQYVSMILEIDKECKYLILDELNPAEGHKQVEKGKEFLVSSSHNGVAVYYKSVVEEIITQDNLASYKMHFPETFEYKQQRDSFRVNITLNPLDGAITHEDKELKGKIIDISFSGLKFKFDGEIKINKEKIIKNCYLFNEKDKFTFNLRPALVSFNEEKNFTTLGGKFLDLDPRQNNIINKLVQKLQREQRQKDVDM